MLSINQKRKNDIDVIKVCSKKVKEQFNWVPKYDLEAGLRKIIDT